MAINELRAIATFAKAVELGSIRQAALAQGISPQAAAQAIAQLEKHLGVRLLHRSTRSLALTEEGQHFLERARPALLALEEAVSTAREGRDEFAGPLRVVGPRSSFVPLVAPLAQQFSQHYPQVQLDVQLSDSLGDWVADRVDIGFRIGGSPDADVIARALFPIQMLVCATPAYLERHGVPSTWSDLARHRCSAFRHPATGKITPWYLQTEEGTVAQRYVSPAFSTNDTDLELQAVLSGDVMGQLANMAATPYLRSGQLVPLLLQHLCSPVALHIYYGHRNAQPKRVRAFWDMAIARFLNTEEIVLSAHELRAAADRFAA